VIIAVGDIYAQLSRREPVRELMRSTAPRMLEEPGCVSYVFAETLEDPGHFVVVQQWRDQDAFERHYRGPAFAEYRERIGDSLARISELHVHVVGESYTPTDEDAELGPPDVE